MGKCVVIDFQYFSTALPKPTSLFRWTAIAFLVALKMVSASTIASAGFYIELPNGCWFYVPEGLVVLGLAMIGLLCGVALIEESSRMRARGENKAAERAEQEAARYRALAREFDAESERIEARRRATIAEHERNERREAAEHERTKRRLQERW